MEPAVATARGTRGGPGGGGGGRGRTPGGGGPPCGRCRRGRRRRRSPRCARRPGTGARRGRCSRRCGCSTGTGGGRGRTRPGATAAPGCGTAPARSARGGSRTGSGWSARSEWSSPPLRATISAFSFSTRTTARRIGTTQSGSKLALSSSALPKRSRPPSPALAVRRQSTGARRVRTACHLAAPSRYVTTSWARVRGPGRTGSRGGTGGSRGAGRAGTAGGATSAGRASLPACATAVGQSRRVRAPEPSAGAGPEASRPPVMLRSVRRAAARLSRAARLLRLIAVQSRHRLPRHTIVRSPVRRPARQRRARDPGQAGGGPARARVPVRRGPPAHRGRARRRQDVDGQGHRPVDRRHVAAASSSRPTCCRPTSPACRCGTGSPNEFEFRPGGVFANVVLADEINRASPKTQSALLEAMEERQVTVDTQTYRPAAPVHGDRDPEPDRARGHLSPAGGAARPVPHAHPDGLPEPRRRGRRSSTPMAATPAWRSSRRSTSAAEIVAGGRARSPTCTSPTI